VAGKGPIYRFGDIEVEPAAHRAARGAEELAFEPKAYAVLVALLEEAGNALGRDELLDRVWGHRHVTPGVLNRVIAQLRKALGDDAEHPRYIQTLHSLGYRFIAEVERIDPDAPVAERHDAQLDAESAESPLPRTEAPVAGAQTHSHDAIFHAWRWIAIAATVAVLGALAWTRFHHAPARTDASIAVLPFTSLSSDRNDRYFAEGLAIEMHDALAGVKGLKVAALLSPEAGNDWRDARQVGDRLGVATVLDASVRRDGGRLRISAHLSDTRTGYVLWSHVYDRQAADVFATQAEIAGDVVVSLLGTMPGDDGALERRLAPTRSAVAYSDYLLGVGLLRSGDEGAEDRATRAFNAALGKDAAFAQAQAYLCRIQLRRFQNAHDPDAFEAAQGACARARELAPGDADVHTALGDLYRLDGQAERAASEYRAAVAEDAGRAGAQIGLAILDLQAHRRDEAARRFGIVLRQGQDDALLHAEIGYQYYLAGDLARATALYADAVRLDAGNGDNWGTYGSLLLVAGDLDRAETALRRAVAIEPNASVFSNLGEIEYRRGRYPQAASLQRQALSLDAKDPIFWSNLGDALFAGNAPPGQLRQAYSQCARLVDAYLEVDAHDPVYSALQGWCRANLGDEAGARTALDESSRGEDPTGEAAFMAAASLAMLGDLRSAKAALQKARAAGVPESRIRVYVPFIRAGLVPQPVRSGSSARSAPRGTSS
jgi:TolB-like protein/DNA-binding winged helix-turn-helix (wHTH) protein/Flp pilus assembly protein TadD